MHPHLIHSTLKGRHVLAVLRLLSIPGYIQYFIQIVGYSVDRDTKKISRSEKIDINYEYVIGRHVGLMIVVAVINSIPYGRG